MVAKNSQPDFQPGASEITVGAHQDNAPALDNASFQASVGYFIQDADLTTAGLQGKKEVTLEDLGCSVVVAGLHYHNNYCDDSQRRMIEPLGYTVSEIPTSSYPAEARRLGNQFFLDVKGIKEIFVAEAMKTVVDARALPDENIADPTNIEAALLKFVRPARNEYVENALARLVA